MLDRFLLAWLVGLSGLAYLWPKLLPAVPDPFPWLATHIHLLIITAMFSIGLMIPHNELRNVLRRWRSVGGGTATQYLTMPLLALLAGTLWIRDEGEFIGVVLVGCVPGAMASNVLTLKAQGNVSYSVSLTTVATLVSPLAVPLAILVTLQTWAGNHAWTLLRSSLYMTTVVVLPVLAGFSFRHYTRRMLTHTGPIPRFLANLAILLIIATVVAQNRPHFTQLAGPMLAALLCINLGGYLFGYTAGKLIGLDPPMRRALTLEVGMQNAGVGVGLATYLFPQHPSIAIAPAIYTFGCMLTGTCLAHLWSRHPPGANGKPDQWQHEGHH
jgi:bile acid:Na+ symporter, BASS family